MTAARFASYRQPRPLDRVLALLDVVHGVAPKFRARCPACGRRSLSVSENAQGAVLVNCFASCTLDEIVAAIGLNISDLFSPRDPVEHQRRNAEQEALRRRYRTTPHTVVREMVVREVARKRATLIEQNGYARPLRAEDLNEVRRRVSSVLGTAPPKPLDAFSWEGAPHDTDADWPLMFELGLRSATDECDRQQLRGVISVSSLRYRATSLAARWVREASGYIAPPIQSDLAAFLVPMCRSCGYCHRPATPHPYATARARAGFGDFE